MILLEGEVPVMGKMTLKEIKSAVNDLPLTEREILIHDLLTELTDLNPDIEKSWIVEADKRLNEIESGKIKCVPASEVIARIKSRIDGKTAISSAS